MKLCPNCESMLPEHYEKCPKCGKELKLDYKIKIVPSASQQEQRIKNPLENIMSNEYNVHDLDDVLETTD